ncbi:MAG: hypothetical protein F4X59_05885 [Holophagales bacterium]|nr:hypothetical protein [Holophagales bacterium]MXX61708.1 hypothetical protein [Holophagales bacterium]MYC09646.1 hypothetical protein [Holophagales bacterium]MYD22631.1 hypothetical protein [Holophagales bacterium]MYI31501.1 hypothetical protein [Holophagales bacterium]
MTVLDHGRSRRSGAFTPALALVGAILAGCTDDPVAETLHLEFFPPSAEDPVPADDDVVEPPDTGGYLKLEARVAIRRHKVPEGNALIERRLNDRTEALMNGYDVWHLRFDSLYEPLADGAEWERAGRELTSYRRWALVGNPDAELQEFFANTPIRPSLVVWDNERRLPDEQRPPPQTVSLEFVSDGGTQATAGESDTVERGLRGFAANAARYQRRVAALWRYMDENPGRRFECLRALFGAAHGDELPESRLAAPPRELAPSTAPPSPPEQPAAGQPVLRDLEIELIERIVDAGAPLLEIFEVPDDDAFTLQELSRRVFDPFPAVITAVPDGAVVEAVGFAESGDGWTIPSLDLWRAYRTLDGRFVSPDPLLFLLDTDGSDFGCDEQDDACKDRERVFSFLERGAFVARPGSSNLVRQVLEAELRPLDVYRLVWVRGETDESADDGEATEGVRETAR